MITLLMLASISWSPKQGTIYEAARELAESAPLQVAPSWSCQVGKRFTYCCRSGLKLVLDPRGWHCEGDPNVYPLFVERATVTKRFRGDML